VLPSVAVLKLRLGIEIAINDTSACLLIYNAQNAPKNAISLFKIKKNFWGGGKAPPPTAPPVRTGYHFIPH